MRLETPTINQAKIEKLEYCEQITWRGSFSGRPNRARPKPGAKKHKPR
jgi:hypothetical protein